MPEISVLMVTYNAEPYIHEAVQSVLNQSFSDFELLIYNDGSTDKTEEIVNSIPDMRIKFFNNKANKGLFYARNAVLKEAKGKYIAILDSDDIALPDRLKIQYQFMESHPEVALCGGNAKIIDKQGLVSRENLHKPYKNEILKVELFFNNIFVNSCTIFRSEVVNSMGGYHDMAPVEDYELFVRIADQYTIYTFNRPLVYYRIHGNNISQKKHDLAVKRLRQIKGLQLTLLNIDVERYEEVFDAALYGKYDKFRIEEFLNLLEELKVKNRSLKKLPFQYFEKRLYAMWYDLVIAKVGKKKALPFLLDKKIFSVKILTWKQLRSIVKLSIKSWF